MYNEKFGNLAWCSNFSLKKKTLLGLNLLWTVRTELHRLAGRG